jgi:hypothetical protein
MLWQADPQCTGLNREPQVGAVIRSASPSIPEAIWSLESTSNVSGSQAR